MYKQNETIYKDIRAVDWARITGVTSAPYKYAVCGVGIDEQLYLIQACHTKGDAVALVDKFKQEMRMN